MGLTPLPFSSLQLSPILNWMTDTWHIGNPTVKKKKKLSNQNISLSPFVSLFLSHHFFSSTVLHLPVLLYQLLTLKIKSSFFSLLPLHRFPFLICFSPSLSCFSFSLPLSTLCLQKPNQDHYVLRTSP